MFFNSKKLFLTERRPSATLVKSSSKFIRIVRTLRWAIFYVIQNYFVKKKNLYTRNNT